MGACIELLIALCLVDLVAYRPRPKVETAQKLLGKGEASADDSKNSMPAKAIKPNSSTVLCRAQKLLADLRMQSRPDVAGLVTYKPRPKVETAQKLLGKGEASADAAKDSTADKAFEPNSSTVLCRAQKSQADSGMQSRPDIAGLVTYKPRPKVETAQKLLGKGEATADDSKDSMPDKAVDLSWRSLFKPNVSIALVNEGNVHAANAVPPWVSFASNCECRNAACLAESCIRASRWHCRPARLRQANVSIALVNEGNVHAANAVPPWVSSASNHPSHHAACLG